MTTVAARTAHAITAPAPPGPAALPPAPQASTAGGEAAAVELEKAWEAPLESAASHMPMPSMAGNAQKLGAFGGLPDVHGHGKRLSATEESYSQFMDEEWEASGMAGGEDEEFGTAGMSSQPRDGERRDLSNAGMNLQPVDWDREALVLFKKDI